ncbi:unnamed protein product [Callosobruchus maculatus]|uniref:Uncharacterized protein n=1 Tax=Callosobruchus maculatus TaxID=64391 RepID=A0A653DA87_CALMS|nr:unnamed protein product [Callosobruchus maculatus]VEN56943.1 unnamed protein product [Callosobruchus maculatus]
MGVVTYALRVEKDLEIERRYSGEGEKRRCESGIPRRRVVASKNDTG